MSPRLLKPRKDMDPNISLELEFQEQPRKHLYWIKKARMINGNKLLIKKFKRLKTSKYLKKSQMANHQRIIRKSHAMSFLMLNMMAGRKQDLLLVAI
jgi:hypothetical protein